MSRNKHVFTCPDVLYMRSKQKKYNRIAITGVAGSTLALFLVGKYLDHKETKQLTEQHLKAVPND